LKLAIIQHGNGNHVGDRYAFGVRCDLNQGRGTQFMRFAALGRRVGKKARTCQQKRCAGQKLFSAI
jgi:hypothetical protein